MEFTITFTGANKAGCDITKTSRDCSGFTLAEMLVSMGVGGIVLAAVMSFSLFAARSFQAIGNYSDLAGRSRVALDTMSSDIRQANCCSSNSFSATNLTLLMTDPVSGRPYTVSYGYDTGSGTVTRTYTGTNGSRATLLLSNCTSFAFSYFQRNPTNGAWGAFPNDINRADQCKLVQIDWTSSRDVLGRCTNSDNSVSARVVIRKE